MSESSLTAPLHELLRTTRLSSLLKDREVVSLDADCTVDEALRTLSEHRLLAAPLRLDEATAKSESLTGSPTPTVFLDIRDILSSFMHDLGDELLRETPAMLTRMRRLEERGLAFAEQPVRRLHTIGGDGLLLDAAAAPDLTLDAALREGFLKGEVSGARAPDAGAAPPPGAAQPPARSVTHRLGLADSRGRVVGILSQTDVVRWLAGALRDFPALAGASVASLGLGARRVEGVGAETPALDALAAMRAARVSALAVLGEDGALIGNFSVSDLRSILAEHFGSLALPVGEFLAREHGTEYRGYAAQAEGDGPRHAFLAGRPARPGADVGQELVTCSASSTLESVVAKLVKNGLHRLYVCDNDLRPVGVITLTDILRRVCLSRA
ncbi:hypothetical protein ACKKBG_A33755 [Auxenochlorella protothecoides x Auxenochlorella symbiontica]|uniref:CBS domain-containing protein n=1 Tax=Auxenochlorella protothecoides TaxID=3075 RepID=A0A1D1ZPD2_AUXPR